MTEVRIVPRDSTYHFITNDSNFNNAKPAYRSTFSSSNGGSQLSILAQRFRENWLKCNPSFRDSDDSLTNLTWLFVSSLFDIISKDMNPFSLESDGFGASRGNKFVIDRPTVFANAKISWHPTHPYAGSLLDPQVRMDYRTKWTGKPPFSYASLICLAMRELGKPKVTLSDIYGWIMANFAYYRHTDSSWQNSVRHNLSLNKCFEKVPREKGERGKGGFWRVNPRHADWLEANLAKCRRAAPPPGPPPPIPRSLLLEKQQEQQQQQHYYQQQPHHTDGIYLTFSPTASQPAPLPQQSQPQQHHASTLICYQSVSVPPDVSNEIETVTVKTASEAFQQHQSHPQAQPHVRRRKTPPCSMYPPAEKFGGEPDLVEVGRKPPPYPAFSNRKRLALAASASRQRHSMWSQSLGLKRDTTRPGVVSENGYINQKSWKSEESGSRFSHFQSASSFAVRKRRNLVMDTSEAFYLPQARRQQPTTMVDTYEHKLSTNEASTYAFASTSEGSKSRVETQMRQTLPEEQTSLLPDHISLPCLDSLPGIAEEPENMETNTTVVESWKEDFFDFPGVLPWQTVSAGEDRSNLTVECNTPDLEPTSRTVQSPSSSSPSPLASFASFGQSVASSTSSNTDSGVASLVNPSDGLDLGPLDLDFDTVSSALNDLVESNSCVIPPIDVDFADLGDSMSKSLQTPTVSSASAFDAPSESRDFNDSTWNFDINNGVSEGGFFENGLALT
ncbi:Forkhead box protein J1-B [Echinococcus granulosus]|nr:Forkhead box protein J1-B [Echinococcus granulosus]